MLVWVSQEQFSVDRGAHSRSHKLYKAFLSVWDSPALTVLILVIFNHRCVQFTESTPCFFKMTLFLLYKPACL